MSNIYIGVDPDVQNSGWSVWSRKEKRILEFTTLSFWDIIARLEELPDPDDVTVVIEAGFLNSKSNFHWAPSRAVGEKIGMNTGRNHQVGILIKEFCEKKGINFELSKPGKNSHKWDAETFRRITGIDQRSNSEERDAIKLVFGR